MKSIITVIFAYANSVKISAKPENQQLLGSFNLDGWTSSKISTVEQMAVFTEIIERYGVLQISGIETGFEQDFSDVIAKIDDNRGVYKTIFCESQKGVTQGFVYRSDFWIEAETQLYVDLNGDFSRPPCGAVFVDPHERPVFIVGVDNLPNNTIAETNALATVYDSLYAQFAGPCIHPAIHMVGSFYLGCDYASQEDIDSLTLKNDDEFHWWIQDDEDSTVGEGDCAYERIVSNYGEDVEVVEKVRAQVFRYDEELNVEKSLAMAISGHYPVEMWFGDEEIETTTSTTSTSTTSTSITSTSTTSTSTTSTSTTTTTTTSTIGETTTTIIPEPFTEITTTASSNPVLATFTIILTSFILA